MRSGADVIRSLKVYTWLALGGPSRDWDVRLADEEAKQGRPNVQIVDSSPQDFEDGPAHRSDAVQTFTIYAYPPDYPTVDEALAAAMLTEEKLINAFELGAVEPGHRRLVPLWDFAGLPLSEVSWTRRYPDYARVRSFSTDREQSKEKETLWTVIAEIRLHWSRGAAMPQPGRPLQEIRVAVNPS